MLNETHIQGNAAQMKSFNPFRSAAVLVSVTLLAACSDSNFPSDGFKSTKFGMSAGQLEGIGFSCTPDKRMCERKADEKNEAAKTETLFGKPADIDVELSDDKVSSIDVRVGIEEKEMVELFSKALGSPKTFEYTALLGDKIRRYYWISSGVTSIAVTVNLDKEPLQGIFKVIGPRSTAKYRNQGETAAMLNEINRSSVKPKDL